MAENVTLNAGAGGDVAAADDIGGVKFQRVKLIQGADGVNDGDTSLLNPFPTRPLYLPVTIQTSFIRPANVTAYAAGDAVADAAAVAGGFTLAGMARVSGGGGIITDMLVTSDNDPATRLVGEVWLFNQSVTSIADNAAYAVSDAEILTCIGCIPFATFDAGNNSFSQVAGLNMLYNCVGSANLRFLMRTRNAYTPASGEAISVTLKALQIN